MQSTRLLTKENIGTCDVVLVAIYPEAAVDYLREHGARISEQSRMVIDCCGTKRVVCEALLPAGKGIRLYVSSAAIPMAGTHNSGFKYARANLYHGAPMVLVPPVFDDIELLQRAKDLLAPAGFGKFSVTTAEAHDEMIAFTSQLAHVVSNAYIKSPTARQP